MKTLYLDIFSGISGDMLIGALIDLGVNPATLGEELKKLRLDGYHLHVGRAEKSHIRGTKFDVHLDHDHDHADHAARTSMNTNTHARRRSPAFPFPFP